MYSNNDSLLFATKLLHYEEEGPNLIGDGRVAMIMAPSPRSPPHILVARRSGTAGARRRSNVGLAALQRAAVMRSSPSSQ